MVQHAVHTFDVALTVHYSVTVALVSGEHVEVNRPTFHCIVLRLLDLLEEFMHGCKHATLFGRRSQPAIW
jgi:hypothetical protein